MSFIILRTKSLRALASHVLKLKAPEFLSGVAFQRNISANTAVNFVRKRSFRDDTDRYPSLLQNEENDNFGKVVELDLAALEDEEKGSGRSKKKKKKANRKSVRTDKSKDTTNDKELKPSENENNLKVNDIRNQPHLFINLIASLRKKKFREEKKLIYLEGKRVISGAMAAGHSPLKIFFSRYSDIEKFTFDKKVRLYKIFYKDIKLIMDTVTTQGVVGVFKMPDYTILKKPKDAIPVTLICDNVRDPGNLGTIIRIAASVGCEKIILTEGCVDIWDQKVLRAGAGAHFHTPIMENMKWSKIESEIPKESKVVLADNQIFTDPEKASESSEEKVDGAFSRKHSSENLPLYNYFSLQFSKQNTTIIIGGETHGLSDKSIEFASKREGVRVQLPMSNTIESLNCGIVTGILLYEFKRQLLSEISQEICDDQNCNTKILQNVAST